MAAIAAVLIGLVAMLTLGLLLDLSLLASRRAGLETAADAAARAAYAACQGAPDAGCATEIAGSYLAMNAGGAVLERIAVSDTGRVEVTASLVVDRPFAALFHAAPVQMHASAGYVGT